MNPRVAFLTSPLVFALTAAMLWALSPSFDNASWALPSLAIVALTAVVVTCLRQLSARIWGPSVLALLVGVALILTVHPGGAMQWVSLSAPWSDFEAGTRELVTGHAPVSASAPMVLVIRVMLVVLYLLAELLTSAWQRGGLAGLAICLPLLATLSNDTSPPLAATLTLAFIWLLLLSATRPNVGDWSEAKLVRGSIAATSTVALTLLAATGLSQTGLWGVLPGKVATVEDGSQINLEIRVRNSLTTSGELEQFRYTAPHKLDVFRLHTLRDFDGERWVPQTADYRPGETTSAILWPTDIGTPFIPLAERVPVGITVLGLSENALPLPPFPRQVDTLLPWSYSQESDQATTFVTTYRGLKINIDHWPDRFSADELRNTQTALAEPELHSLYTAVPNNIDRDRVQDLAESLTAGMDSSLDKALAIQQYLRGPQFTYDVNALPGSADPVSAFLDSQRGYCVQFATTMVIMLRTLDIPTRMGVGYLGGQAIQNGEYRVRGVDAHTWPEVYFDGVGWMRFEPTPAVQTGVAPTYGLEPRTPEDVSPSDPIEAEDPLSEQPNLEPGSALKPAESESTNTRWVAIVAAVLAIVSASLWWIGRRRNRISPSTYDQLWEHTRQSLGQYAWAPSMTPYEAEDYLDQVMRTRNIELSPPSSQAWNTLVRSVVAERYRPPARVTQSQASASVVVSDDHIAEIASLSEALESFAKELSQDKKDANQA